GRKRQAILHRRSQGIFFQTICRYARGAAIEDSTNRNGHAMFGNVLVNDVVGKTRERIDHPSTCTSVPGTPRAFAIRRTTSAMWRNSRSARNRGLPVDTGVTF